MAMPWPRVMRFRALRDLVVHTGIPPAWAWLCPAIIDTAIGVSTMMLVALGDKPARRARTVITSGNPQTPTIQRLAKPAKPSAKAEVAAAAARRAGVQTVQAERVQMSASAQPDLGQTVHYSAQTDAQVDADLASELIASRLTTQPAETVIAVLAATRDGASINAAAKASGINYRTARRIVEGAEHQQRQLAAASPARDPPT